MAEQKPFNLFVYGTLMNPSIFRAVLGIRLVFTPNDADGAERFYVRQAVLDDYKKVSPDNTYLYAVPDPHGRIRGYLVGPLPGKFLSALRKYEGRNYSRRTLQVQTSGGIEQAVVFIGNIKELEHSFGYAFRDPLKQEIILGRKIDAALLEAEREQLHTTEKTARRAVGELRGPTIRDLVRRHFEAGGISDYAIRHSLKDPPLRDFSRIVTDPEAQAIAANYLAMVVRQVLFNQFEENIRRDFRFELDQMYLGSDYYERTISSLAALRLLNDCSELVETLVRDCLTGLDFQKDHLVDFVRWAIVAADSLYDVPQAGHQIVFIKNHIGRGYIPLGAELEFSNIGHDVIHDPEGRLLRDLQYDGFLYFSDFALDALTWKLGGHIDDHHEKSPGRPRRGFFEVALGSLSIEANISKPVTNDPWLLNQLIHEARRFFKIAPHSVHISLQLRSQHRPDRDRLLPPEVMQCLFALAGDPVRDEEGKLQISRLVSDEIITRGPAPKMLFSEITRRHSSDVEDSDLPVSPAGRGGGRYVQQFRFLRLSSGLNYEPIIMAMKGLQISLRPGSFLTAAQYSSSRKHRERFEQLLQWGQDAKAISQAAQEQFLAHIYSGLMTERRGKPAHSEAYIAWSLSQLRAMIKKFNELAGTEKHRQKSP